MYSLLIRWLSPPMLGQRFFGHDPLRQTPKVVKPVREESGLEITRKSARVAAL
jgi:hypothetical protein